MNILVLKPGQRMLDYSYFAANHDSPVAEGRLADFRGMRSRRQAVAEIVRRVRKSPGLVAPDAIAVRGIFGGPAYREATLVDPAVMDQLEKQIPDAPMHLPPLLALVRLCGRLFPGVPVVFFETAFFVDLPGREHLYAVDPELAGTPGLRRYGFHGLLHEAACGEARRHHREQGAEGAARILSICLESRPEVAAVVGMRPVMVTSGATPLEGLPGPTTCGELDPSIVITLAQKMGWGPEQIDRVLVRESGWLGLTGRAATVAELFEMNRSELQLARRIFQYRILQAAGAGMAAMGGLDVVVFSGRFGSVGTALGPWLQARLALATRPSGHPIAVEFYHDPLDRVLADHAAARLAEIRGLAAAA